MCRHVHAHVCGCVYVYVRLCKPVCMCVCMCVHSRWPLPLWLATHVQALGALPLHHFTARKGYSCRAWVVFCGLLPPPLPSPPWQPPDVRAADRLIVLKLQAGAGTVAGPKGSTVLGRAWGGLNRLDESRGERRRSDVSESLVPGPQAAGRKGETWPVSHAAVLLRACVSGLALELSSALASSANGRGHGRNRAFLLTTEHSE